MRTSSIAAASALIAVVALVAIAGPAATQAPGDARTPDADAFTRFSLEGSLGGATAAPTLDPSSSSAGLVDRDSTLFGAGAPLVPGGRVEVDQPNPPPGVLLKPTPTPEPRPVVPSVSGASAVRWRTAEYSWYGPGFYGSGTACGQTYSKTILGVAHKTLPCGTRVTLRNPENGRTITVRVIDRGPYVDGRMWDLSRGTCDYLDNCYTSLIQWRLP